MTEKESDATDTPSGNSESGINPDSGNSVLAALAAALPARALSTDPEVIAEHATDASEIPPLGPAIAVVFPGSTAEVSKTLRIANEHRVPVVPQGALTGLAGAATAVAGAILLNMSRMDQIIAIDETDRAMIVQPAVPVAQVDAAARRQGLFYPPDPASAKWCSIGGSISTNAGGMRCLKYGVTRDSVRSLEVVLADGTVIETRARTMKAVAGLDLTGLFVGSEGTLGVVTEATLALRPAPGPERGVVGTFRTLPEALDVANILATGKYLPAALELLDAAALDAIRVQNPDLGIDPDAQVWLLAGTDEHFGASEYLDEYEQQMRAGGALTISRSTTDAEHEQLLATRRALHGALRAVRGASLNGDISVPRSELGTIVERIAEISEETGRPIAIGGHVGDGNLHPVIGYDPDDPEDRHRAEQVHALVLEATQELGGTMTGEHGVGVDKLPALDGEMVPEIRQLQHAIKKVLDPHGILNPGKMY